MTRKELALLMLALAEGKPYSPVQIQKSLFLATDNLSDLLDQNSSYNFEPYDYGPFDKVVYDDLRELEHEGFAEITTAPSGRWNEYRATREGIEAVQNIKNSLAGNDRKYLIEMSSFVRSLSFSQLVAAIYKAYPDMKENSIFVT